MSKFKQTRKHQCALQIINNAVEIWTSFPLPPRPTLSGLPTASQSCFVRVQNFLFPKNKKA